MRIIINMFLLMFFLLGLNAYAAGGVVNGQPVNASITNSAFLFKNGDDTSSYNYSFTGYLGIGTTATTSQRLLIYDNAGLPGIVNSTVSNTYSPILYFQRARAGPANLATSDALGSVYWKGYVNGGYQALGRIGVNYQGNGTTYDSNMTFWTGEGSSLTQRMILFPDGNLTIGAASENGTTLDVRGSLSASSYTGFMNPVATTATISALSTTYSIISFTGTTATEVQGMVGPVFTVNNAQTLWIQNRSTANITFKDQNGGASAANQIILPNSTDFILYPGTGALFTYDPSNTKWRLTSFAFSVGAFGSSPNASGASFSGSVLTLQPADATNPGGVTTGAQTFAGAKTFSSTIVGNISGNAGTATVGTTVTTTATGTNASYYIPFAPLSTTSNQALGVDAGLSYNPSTDTLTVTNISGSVTTATNATNTAITDDTTTNATMYPTWVTATTGNLPQKVSSSKLTFNPSTGTLTTTTVAAALTGTASGNTTYTPNQYGVVLSGAANTMTVLAPDASVTKVLTSGGASANPSWQDIGTLSGAVPVGTITAYVAKTPPSGWLVLDGSQVSRATYATLYGIMNPSLGTFTVTIASPAVATLTGHGLQSCELVQLTTSGALPTGLAANTDYYVTRIDANTFNLSTSLANCVAGTKINTSGTQSGTHTAQFFSYGSGNGTTTFTLPDMRGRIAAGSDTMGGTAASRLTTLKTGVSGGTNAGFGAAIANAGGREDHQLTTAQLAAHSHSWTTYQGTNTIGAFGRGDGVNVPNVQSSNNTGGDNAHNNVQPTIITYYIIKY